MIITSFQYLKGAYREAREGLFDRYCSDRTRNNECKLKDRKFSLDIRKKFFSVREVTLEQTAQEGVEYPNPSGLQSQVG